MATRFAIACCALVSLPFLPTSTEAATSLVGLRLAHNSPAEPQYISIDAASGNVTGFGKPFSLLVGMGDLRELVGRTYYVFGDSEAGSQLWGINTKNGEPTCVSTVDFLEAGFVGIGQSMTYDSVNHALIVSGLAKNKTSTGGVDHKILRFQLPTSTSSSSSSSSSAAPPSCGSVEQIASFPYSGDSPMIHGSALDAESQTLYTTIDYQKVFSLAAIDLKTGILTKDMMEKQYPVAGMKWDSTSKKIVGASQYVEDVIQLITIDPKTSKTTARALKWGQLVGGNLQGNDGEVMAFNSKTREMHLVVQAKMDSESTQRIATIDWTTGTLSGPTPRLTFPPIDGAADPFMMVVQMTSTA